MELTLLENIRIYLGHAYRAGQNGTPERFMDDLAEDVVKFLGTLPTPVV